MSLRKASGNPGTDGVTLSEFFTLRARDMPSGCQGLDSVQKYFLAYILLHLGNNSFQI